MRLPTSTYATFNTIEPDAGRIATTGNPPVHARGMLPGETAHVHVLRQRKRRLLAEAIHIKQRSMYRRPVHESHYLACSPWQNISYNIQQKTKQDWLTAAFKEPDAFYAAPQEFGYRTNIQYGFAGMGRTLRFRLRGHNSHLTTSNGCILASETMNTAAREMRDVLATLDANSTEIKSMMIRESKSNDKRLAILYVLPDSYPAIPLPSCPHIDGIVIVQADPAYRAPVGVKVISTTGKDYLEEVIAENTIAYGYTDFWQNNMPLFAQALSDMQRHILPDSNVVELYAGTGVIGLSISKYVKSIRMYERADSMVVRARENIEKNTAPNASAEALPAESVQPEHIEHAQCVVVDPTRRGLATETVRAITTALPEQVLYLSCNIQTLTRDIQLLRQQYNIQHIFGYDFYPNTPHLETLVVLRRKL